MRPLARLAGHLLGREIAKLLQPLRRRVDLAFGACPVKPLSSPRHLHQVVWASAAQQVAGLKFWRPLNIGGDFAWFREHPSRWGLYARLKPDFRRWAFFAVWEEEAALEEFLTASETGRKWREATAEACHLWLRP